MNVRLFYDFKSTNQQVKVVFFRISSILACSARSAALTAFLKVSKSWAVTPMLDPSVEIAPVVVASKDFWALAKDLPLIVAELVKVVALASTKALVIWKLVTAAKLVCVDVNSATFRTSFTCREKNAYVTSSLQQAIFGQFS